MGKDSQLVGYAIHVVMIVLGLLAIIPIYVLLINATRTTEQINTGFVIIPGKDAFFSSVSTVVTDWSSGDESGTARYFDLNMGRTLKEETNKKTGVLEKIVVKSFTESLQPRVEIFNDENESIALFILVDNTVVFVEDGKRVQKGETIARLVKRPNVAFNWRVLNGRGKDTINIFQGFGNSAFISLSATLLSIYFSAMTAYGLQVYRFKGRTILWTVILVVIMLPATLSIIGFVQFISRIKLRDNYIPLIIPGIAAAGTVLFLRQYMMSVLSTDLIDAARIDGAGEYRIFNLIILPIMAPALAAQSIFTFVGSWNNFMTPFILISNDKKYTLPMIVLNLRGNMYRSEIGAIYLGIAVSLIPIIIFYSFMSRFIISGLTMGGLKE
jgi:multiple sugar transport system permease protein